VLAAQGLREHTGDGPAEPLRRVVKIRSSIVKRRTAVFQRLDAQLELLGPAWYDALGSNYGKAALALLSRYADPHSVVRLGHARRGNSPSSLLRVAEAFPKALPRLRQALEALL
jgi:hypothetical protein